MKKIIFILIISWLFVFQKANCQTIIPESTHRILVFKTIDSLWTKGKRKVINIWNKINFKEKAPFYSSLWFKFMMLLILILTMVIYVFNLEKKQRWMQKVINEKANEIVKLKQAEINRKMYEIELTALRSQLNPHFLFNSLSSIQNFVNKNDRYSANIYLSRFAKLMRKTLEQSNMLFICVAEEIETLKLYVELEKLRFPFQFEIIIDENIDIQNTEIPGMFLQPLIENAIKHGISQTEEKGKIILTLQKNQDTITCLVDDNGIGIHSRKPIIDSEINHKEAGLELLHKRLNLLSQLQNNNISFTLHDKKETVGTQGTLVSIDLPIMQTI